jgi:succinyl-diaminopimelate desuccinylase
MAEELENAVSAAEAAEAVGLLARLVACDSINPPGPTAAVAAECSGFLDLAGIAHRVLARDPQKPNILARLDNGPGGHLVLNAHLDTVPPGDAAAWRYPPLALTEAGGRLYGLGTGNMKAAAVAMLLAFRRLKVQRAAWSGSVTLSLVADECVFGPDGAAFLLEAHGAEVLGDWLICGEGPGAMGLALAEKGLMWVRLRAAGRVGQGMLTTRQSSAPARLAEALIEIDAWNERKIVPPLALLDHAGNAEGQRVSANIGRISGGAGFSPAVSAAEADIDLRLPPGLSRVEVGGWLDALCTGRGLEWQEIKGWEANWSTPDSAPVIAIAGAAVRVRGRPAQPVTRLPASDAARWRAAGVPAICFGPQAELASGVDDHVERADFLDCIRIYAGAAGALLPPRPRGG